MLKIFLNIFSNYLKFDIQFRSLGLVPTVLNYLEGYWTFIKKNYEKTCAKRLQSCETLGGDAEPNSSTDDKLTERLHAATEQWMDGAACPPACLSHGADGAAALVSTPTQFPENPLPLRLQLLEGRKTKKKAGDLKLLT